MEAVAVFRFDFRSVLNGRLFVDQIDHALHIGLKRNQLRDARRLLAEGLEQAQRIRHERAQHAEAQRSLKHHAAAAQQRGAGRQRAAEHNQRHVDRAHAPVQNACPRRVGGCLFKFISQAAFQRKGFAGLRAHDAFVVAAGDFRVLSAHLAVEHDQLFLEIHRQRGDDRRNHDDRHRQTRRQREHHAQHAEDIRKAPEDIRKNPCQTRRDAVGVAHHAREHVSRAGHVIIIQA